MENKFSRFLTTLVGGLIFGLAAGFMIIIIMKAFPSDSSKLSTDETVQEVDGVEQSEDDLQTKETIQIKESTKLNVSDAIVYDVTSVVDEVMPCVVSIFGNYDVPISMFGYSMDYEAEGSGSGIIIEDNGTELLIVTNNHVVEDSTELSVQFIDDSIAKAMIKGRDSEMDLAVIAVDFQDIDEQTKEDIRVATIGDSDKLKVGEPAIAIGNALGYGQSVTTGVISAVNRAFVLDDDYGYPVIASEMDNEEELQYLLQTDAAINPGNSGGALLNAKGEVIGINSSKIAGSTVEGMGYAIPITKALPIMKELMEKKTRVHNQNGRKAYFGVSGIGINEAMQDKNNIPPGLYITQVFTDTPASRAGISKGDILLSLDGEAVTSLEELSELLCYIEEGTSVKAEILKRSSTGYKEKEITIILGGKE